MTEQHFQSLQDALRDFADPPDLKMVDGGIEVEKVGTVRPDSWGFNLYLGGNRVFGGTLDWAEIRCAVVQILADRIIGRIKGAAEVPALTESHADLIRAALAAFPNPPRVGLANKGVVVEGVGRCYATPRGYVLYYDGAHNPHFGARFGEIAQRVARAVLDQANELKGSP